MEERQRCGLLLISSKREMKRPRRRDQGASGIFRWCLKKGRIQGGLNHGLVCDSKLHRLFMLCGVRIRMPSTAFNFPKPGSCGRWRAGK